MWTERVGEEGLESIGGEGAAESTKKEEILNAPRPFNIFGWIIIATLEHVTTAAGEAYWLLRTDLPGSFWTSDTSVAPKVWVHKLPPLQMKWCERSSAFTIHCLKTMFHSLPSPGKSGAAVRELQKHHTSLCCCCLAQGQRSRVNLCAPLCCQPSLQSLCSHSLPFSFFLKH